MDNSNGPPAITPADECAVLRQGLIAELTKRLKKEKTKLDKMTAELDECGQAPLHKKRGELLAIHQQNITQGTPFIEVDDLYAPGQKIIIELDPAISVQANVKGYFKHYKKLQSRREILPRVIEKVRKEISRIEGFLPALAAADTLEAVEKIKAQWQPPLAPAALKTKKELSHVPSLKLRQFTTSTGWAVFVGKTDRDNDLLTFRFANPHDYWLHVMGAPGSHVVLRLAQRNAIPDPTTLKEAAGLAAYYSKLKKGRRVPVQYTQVKFVRKPKKAKPGLVFIEREKTLFVEPHLLNQKTMEP
jgi:predicted ribosome quality control (RQC) complex YloA/Tae2 family protein